MPDRPSISERLDRELIDLKADNDVRILLVDKVKELEERLASLLGDRPELEIRDL